MLYVSIIPKYWSHSNRGSISSAHMLTSSPTYIGPVISCTHLLILITLSTYTCSSLTSIASLPPHYIISLDQVTWQAYPMSTTAAPRGIAFLFAHTRSHEDTRDSTLTHVSTLACFGRKLPRLLPEELNSNDCGKDVRRDCGHKDNSINVVFNC